MSVEKDGETFSWSSNDEDIVIPQVDAVAVYLNPRGDVVIRQRDSMGDDDSFVVVHPSHVEGLVRALLETVGK